MTEKKDNNYLLIGIIAFFAGLWIASPIYFYIKINEIHNEVAIIRTGVSRMYERVSELNNNCKSAIYGIPHIEELED